MNLTGTLTNTGNTFTFDATTGSWNLAGGTVLNGSLVFQAGQSLPVRVNASNRLNGVAITGDLLPDTTNAVVRILNGLNDQRRGAGERRRRVAGLRRQPDWSAGTVGSKARQAAGGSSRRSMPARR